MEVVSTVARQAVRPSVTNVDSVLLEVVHHEVAATRRPAPAATGQREDIRRLRRVRADISGGRDCPPALSYRYLAGPEVAVERLLIWHERVRESSPLNQDQPLAANRKRSYRQSAYRRTRGTRR